MSNFQLIHINQYLRHENNPTFNLKQDSRTVHQTVESENHLSNTFAKHRAYNLITHLKFILKVDRTKPRTHCKRLSSRGRSKRLGPQ